MPSTVDEYLAELPEGPRVALEKLRQTIKAAAPEATETIAYNMPAFRLQGRFLVSYAAYKNHCSLYPWSQAMIDELGEQLAPYVSGKGTLRFRAEQPIPAALVKRIIEIRLDETSGGS
jgi:uncharacterized protein YdhG (YjbR/CyaY superfamily)